MDEALFMGCVFVKQGVSVTPAVDHSVDSERNSSITNKNKKKKKDSGESVGLSWSEVGESGRTSLNGGNESLSFRLGNLSKYVEGEQAAAGWPAWLSAVASEAIHGWVPLRSDAFEKLDKVCYSCRMFGFLTCLLLLVFMFCFLNLEIV